MFFSDDTPWNIFKITEKTYFKVKTVFNLKIEAETFRDSQSHKKPLKFIVVPRPSKYRPKKQFFMFLWFQGVISCRIKSKFFNFSFPSRVPAIFHWISEGLWKSFFIEEIFNIKNLKKFSPRFFFCNFMNPLILERKFSQTEMSLSQKYIWLTLISENFMII